MRNVKRIPKILARLENVWVKAPDLRFGQLIELITNFSSISLWEMEEDELTKALQKVEIYYKL